MQLGLMSPCCVCNKLCVQSAQIRRYKSRFNNTKEVTSGAVLQFVSVELIRSCLRYEMHSNFNKGES